MIRWVCVEVWVCKGAIICFQGQNIQIFGICSAWYMPELLNIETYTKSLYYPSLHFRSSSEIKAAVVHVYLF